MFINVKSFFHSYNNRAGILFASRECTDAFEHACSKLLTQITVSARDSVYGSEDRQETTIRNFLKPCSLDLQKRIINEFEDWRLPQIGQGINTTLTFIFEKLKEELENPLMKVANLINPRVNNSKSLRYQDKIKQLKRCRRQLNQSTDVERRAIISMLEEQVAFTLKEHRIISEEEYSLAKNN